MAKLPKPGTKAQRRWIRGLWVGKLDRDNTNIILTECGALSVRSVRRLPAEAQANRTLMGSAAGVPWALRQGRMLREPPPMVAQPVVLPAVTVESAEAEEPDEYRELEGPAQLPTMAHEGEPRRLDQEAQDVEAAAILEDLVPLEDSEVFPEAGGVGDLTSELGAPAEENPNTAPEGAGSAASSAAAPPRPPFPTGLGEGGLGQGSAKREGAGTLEEARAPKHPKASAKKAQRIERLRGEAEELWARIERGRPHPDATTSGISDGAARLGPRPSSDPAGKAGPAEEALALEGFHADPQEGQADCGHTTRSGRRRQVPLSSGLGDLSLRRSA